MTKTELKSFKKELREILIKYNVGLMVDIKGDTHGVNTDFVVFDLTTDKETILSDYQSALYPGDLK